MHVGKSWKKLPGQSYGVLNASSRCQFLRKRSDRLHSDREWKVNLKFRRQQSLTALKRSNAGKKNVEMTPTASDQRDITGVGFGVACCLGVGKSSPSFDYGTRCTKKMGQC